MQDKKLDDEHRVGLTTKNQCLDLCWKLHVSAQLWARHAHSSVFARPETPSNLVLTHLAVTAELQLLTITEAWGRTG